MIKNEITKSHYIRTGEFVTFCRRTTPCGGAVTGWKDRGKA